MNFIRASLVLAFFLAPAAVPLVHAQASAANPMRVTSAFPPGSGPDVVVRLVAQKMAALSGRPVVTDNKPGGGGMVALGAVTAMGPSQSELLYSEVGQLVINRLIRKESNADPEKDLVPVGIVARTPFYVVVGGGGPYKTYSDLISRARQSPGRLTYGSSGVGTPLHLGSAQLELATGTKMSHVPYRDFSILNQDIANGVVDWSFGTFGSSGALQKAGNVRFLAIAAEKRSKILPEIPTLAELGGPKVEVSTVLALFAPKGTSTAAAAQMNALLNDALAQPEVSERLEQMGYEPVAQSPKSLQDLMRSETVRYGELVRTTHIKVD